MFCFLSTGRSILDQFIPDRSFPDQIIPVLSILGPPHFLFWKLKAELGVSPELFEPELETALELQLYRSRHLSSSPQRALETSRSFPAQPT